MTELLDLLDQAGIDNLRAGQREIHGSCPRHEYRTGHPDHHPSWSISKHKLTHLCFSCGYKGTLSQLLTDITGTPPGPNLELELKQQSFLRRMAEQDHGVTLAPAPVLTEWALAHLLADVPDRLLALRHLQRPAVDHYGVRWDAERHSWVLPLRDPQGALLGAQYRQKGYVRTEPTGVNKSTTLFGLDRMCSYDYVVLVESPLDSIRLFGLGIPAVASLGAWVSDLQAKLLARIFARVYLALDNDAAGRDGAARLFPTIRKLGAAPVMWYYRDTKSKDVGDVETDGEILDMWNATLSFGMR